MAFVWFKEDVYAFDYILKRESLTHLLLEIFKERFMRKRLGLYGKHVFNDCIFFSSDKVYLQAAKSSNVIKMRN